MMSLNRQLPRHTVSSAAREPNAALLEATADSCLRAREGDRSAWEDLLARYGGTLARFAHGRLPAHARGMTDTCDIVQDAVIRVVGRLDGFEFRHRGALLAYMRQAVRNRIIDLARKAARQPVAVSLADEHVDQGQSPLEQAIGFENAERYRGALARLGTRDRDTIVLRLEQRLSYDEVAAQLEMPSANAARTASMRALRRLASLMAGS